MIRDEYLEQQVTSIGDYVEYWLNVRLGERVAEVAESFLQAAP